MTRHSVATAALIASVSALSAWLRIPAAARDTLWAEDGRNFLQAAVTQGPLFSLFEPYSGYLHTIPRIVASLIVQFAPVPLYAYAMTAATCALAGVAAGVVFVCSRAVIEWMPARMLLAGVTVLAPLEPREVLGNAANLHSIMLWMLFWMLLYRPRSRRSSVVLGVIALFAALTEIQSLFLLPLLFVGLRDRSRWLLRAGYLVGAGTQLAVTLAWPRATGTTPAAGIPSIIYGYLINSVVPLWIPQNSIGASIAAGGAALAVALALPILAAIVVILIRGTGIQRAAAAGLSVGSVLVYSASVLDNPSSRYDYATFNRSQLESLWLTRYGVVPSMMLIAVLIIAVATLRSVRLTRSEKPAPSGKPPRFRAVLRRVPRAALLTAVVVLLAVQFVPQGTRRSSGPVWLPQVAPAAEKCESLPDSHNMRLNETIGWKVSIDCGVLEASG